MHHVAVVTFLTACVAACYTDVRFRRIPNVLTGSACFAILVVEIGVGVVPVLSAVALMAAVIVAGSFVHRMGVVGGGDIKLLAAGAGAFGFPGFITDVLYVFIAGGLIACAYALREGRLRALFRNVGLSAITGTAIVPVTTARRVPYALAIFAGSVVFAASEGYTIWSPLVH